MRKNCKKNILDQDNQFILQTSFGKSILSKKEAVRWLQEKTKMGEKRREKWDQYLN